MANYRLFGFPIEGIALQIASAIAEWQCIETGEIWKGSLTSSNRPTDGFDYKIDFAGLYRFVFCSNQDSCDYFVYPLNKKKLDDSDYIHIDIDSAND